MFLLVQGPQRVCVCVWGGGGGGGGGGGSGDTCPSPNIFKTIKS